MGGWGGVAGGVSAISAAVSSQGVTVDASSPGIGLGLPLDDAVLDDASGLAVLGGDLLALLLGLWDAVLGLNFLISDGALWPGNGGLVGGHFDGWPGNSHWGHGYWSVDSCWGSSVSTVSSDGSSIAAVCAVSIGLSGGGGVGDGSGHAGI